MDQLTFSEADLTTLVEYFNLVATKATFTLTSQEAVKLANLMSGYKQHLQRVEAHIFEIKRIKEAPKQEV